VSFVDEGVACLFNGSEEQVSFRLPADKEWGLALSSSDCEIDPAGAVSLSAQSAAVFVAA
jgi:pullulanase/glycogen debranching enzyme